MKASRRSVRDFFDEWHRTIQPSVRPTTWVNYRDYLDAYVIPVIGDTANGRPLHPDTFTDLFHKHCAAARLPRIRLHDVRHSYATAALKAGIPAKVISERLGHATAAFTLQTYTHIIPGMDEAAAASVAELILALPDSAQNTDVHGSVHTEGETIPEMTKEPADLERFRRSAGSSSCSGGRI